jgi:hypothetical protein
MAGTNGLDWRWDIGRTRSLDIGFEMQTVLSPRASE